jgi:hypothetical protein
MRDAATLRRLAASFHMLAQTADDQTAARLRELADEYEEQAAQLNDDEPTMPIPE